MAANQIEREILIEAPVDVVWDVVTEPEQIAQWWSDEAEFDLRPGGEGTLIWDQRATSGERATAWVRIETVEPPRKFAFRWGHREGAEPNAANSLLVSFTLTAEGDHTRLLVTETGLDRVDWSEATKADYADQHNHGWEVHLANLAGYASQRSRASAA